MKGDILKGKKGVIYHYAIHLDGDLNQDFIGAVLTTKGSDKYKDNVPMKKEHFVEGHKIGFDNSHIIKMRFVKLKEWGPFEKVGELTKEGVKFIEAETNGLGPKLWNWSGPMIWNE